MILAHRLSLRQAARYSWAAEMEGQQQHACRCDCPSLTSPNKQVERESRTGGKQRCHTWLRKMAFWFVDLVMQGRRSRFTSGRKKRFGRASHQAPKAAWGTQILACGRSHSVAAHFSRAASGQTDSAADKGTALWIRSAFSFSPAESHFPGAVRL